METHDGDPRGGANGDPWQEAGERWATIGRRLREQYRTIAGDDGPTEDEVREAVVVLGDAARRIVDAVGGAMRDPAVRDQVRDAAASLVSALGTTFHDLGEELRRDDTAGDPAGDDGRVP